MLAALITTLFAPAFRPTLLYGVPFLMLLTLGYTQRQRHGTTMQHPTVEEMQ
jgi:hypothetical protein